MIVFTFLYVKTHTNESSRVPSNFRLSVVLHTFAAFLLFCMSKRTQTKVWGCPQTFVWVCFCIRLLCFYFFVCQNTTKRKVRGSPQTFVWVCVLRTFAACSLFCMSNHTQTKIRGCPQTFIWVVFLHTFVAFFYFFVCQDIHKRKIEGALKLSFEIVFYIRLLRLALLILSYK